jgi:hypothetical protein
MLNVKKATIEDLNNFIVRADDSQEIWSLARMDGKEALVLSFNNSSECYIAEYNDKVVCMYGCVPDGLGASFWLLFTPDISDLPMSFFRKARIVIDELLTRYEYIMNYAHQDKDFIIRLSKWLGFTVDDAKPYGIDRVLFHRIYKGNL